MSRRRIKLSHRRAAHTGAHTLQFGSELRVLLLDLELGPGSFGVRQGVHDLAFGPAELGGALEILQGIDDLALLQEQLGHRCNGDVALGVDYRIWLAFHGSGLMNGWA